MKKTDREFVLGIVLDATISFAAVYPQIYFLLEHLVRGLEQKSLEARGSQMVFSITLIHDKPESVEFYDKAVFTEQKEEVVEALRNISFSGGDRYGEENLSEAIEYQMKLFERYSQENVADDVNFGLLVLSDSVPGDGNYSPDLASERIGNEGFSHVGLRFAYVYTYREDYMPQFRIVNRKGILTENDVNTCVYGSLEEVLVSSESQMMKIICDMTEDMSEQFEC